MHGRIIQYSHTTGVGIIINNHKKLFDFKLLQWQDKTRIPETDLLVEFKCDEDLPDKVVYIKSSKYQGFSKDSIIKERDFWKTLTDEELERLEQGVFDDLIAQTCKETDYIAMSEIKTSITIESFIKYHFENETHITQHAIKLPTCGYELLDYRIITPFLMRTLDALIYTEKRITKDSFSSYLEIYSKLQYFITPFYLATQDSKKIYEEFLSQQLYFIAAKRKLIDTKDDLLRVENKLRTVKSAISNNEQKLSGSQNKQQAEVREKLAKLQAQAKELSESRVHLSKLKEKLLTLIEDFSVKYEAGFAKQFDLIKENVFKRIRLALNTVVTSLDNKMWQLGMDSDPIKNHYFKLNKNYSFCIMAFILQYMRTLDTSKLNDTNRVLYSYIARYRERNTKSVLIVSSNEKLNQKLRIRLMTLYKDFLVTTIDKKMEYEITAVNQKFDYIIIDNELENANPIEMVVFGKSKKVNRGAKFIIYQIPKII